MDRWAVEPGNSVDGWAGDNQGFYGWTSSRKTREFRGLMDEQENIGDFYDGWTGENQGFLWKNKRETNRIFLCMDEQEIYRIFLLMEELETTGISEDEQERDDQELC
jgi:hypothetical protein